MHRDCVRKQPQRDRTQVGHFEEGPGRWGVGLSMVFQAEDAGRIDGLSISLVGMIEEKTKISVIHDLTFESANRETREGQRRLANADTGRRSPVQARRGPRRS